MVSCFQHDKRHGCEVALSSRHPQKEGRRFLEELRMGHAALAGVKGCL